MLKSPSSRNLFVLWLAYSASNTVLVTEAFAPTPPNAGASLRTANPNTALHMVGGGNLVDRFVRVSKANVNKILSNLEDPEKVVLQAVTDMQRDLVKVRQAYAESLSTQRRLERERDELDQQGNEWHRRAQLALQRGNNEGLAKEALSRRQLYVDQSKGIQLQIDTQMTATDKLYSAMKQLEGKIGEAAAKKQQLVARAKTAKSTQQVNDMLTGLTGKTSMDAFNRMEEKVEALEAAAEASGEMKLLGGMTTPSTASDLELEFQLLEASSEVDDELARMKQDLKLLGGSDTKTSSASKTGRTISIPIETIRDQGVLLD